MKHCPHCRRSYEDAVSFCPADGDVLQKSPEGLVGRVLDGKYEVEEFIAQGGMGAVYRAPAAAMREARLRMLCRAAPGRALLLGALRRGGDWRWRVAGE